MKIPKKLVVGIWEKKKTAARFLKSKYIKPYEKQYKGYKLKVAGNRSLGYYIAKRGRKK